MSVARDSESYQDWLGLFDNELEIIWKDERKELKITSMIYYALQKELSKLRSSLDTEIEKLRSDLKCKDHLQKACTLSKSSLTRQGKAHSNNKENYKFPGIVALQEVNLNDGSSQTILEPDTSSFDKTKCIGSQSLSSPPLNRRKFYQRQPSSPSFSLFGKKHKKSPKIIPETNLRKNKHLKSVEDSVIDCSIIENSPLPTSLLKKSKMSFNNKSSKKKIGKAVQSTTLTQMFDYEEPSKKEKKKLDSNVGSMGLDEILSFWNQTPSEENEDGSNSHSDATLDDLDEFQENPVSPKKQKLEAKTNELPPQREPYNFDHVGVRGKARQQLKGWSCKDCEVLYRNLPPAEREKKLNECSRHRAPPREETFSKFWDLTFGPTPKTPEKQPPVESKKESPESLVFKYNLRR